MLKNLATFAFAAVLAIGTTGAALAGQDGNDLLIVNSGDGSDFLGGHGNDILIGGDGRDRKGGDGNDVVLGPEDDEPTTACSGSSRHRASTSIGDVVCVKTWD